VPILARGRRREFGNDGGLHRRERRFRPCLRGGIRD